MTRFAYVMVTYFTALGMTAACVARLPVKLIWNATASTPVGLYSLDRADHLQHGDLVAIMPDKLTAAFLVGRGYIARDVPLLKHVAALSGDRVCRRGVHITVNGTAAADAMTSDHLGRPLPQWQGCHRLSVGQIFLLNPAVSASLDGRYFGPMAASTVIGRAHALYTDPAGNGHFTWHAATR